VGRQTHAPAALPPGKRLGTAFTDGWVPGTALTDAMKLASIGIRSPDGPTRSYAIYIYIYIQGVSGGITNILGCGSMDYFE